MMRTIRGFVMFCILGEPTPGRFRKDPMHPC